jgi:hypothetical protein
MFTYQEAKEYLIKNLTDDIERYRSGDIWSIGKGYDEYDGNLPRDGRPEFDKLFIALTFWDSWQDARNHEWLYYEGIKEHDWPRLAKIIIEDIKADREISDQLILDWFDLKRREGLIAKIKKLFNKNKTA